MPTILDVPGSNPPNRFFSPIQAVVTSPDYLSLVENTATNLVLSIVPCHDSNRALWELWDAFFEVVVSSSSTYEPHLALLDAIRTQPPTQPKNQRLCDYTQADGKLHWSELPHFGTEWRDVHDTLHEWRHWNGVRHPVTEDGSTGSNLGSSGDQLYLRFINFSAMLLKGDKNASAVHAVWVFYNCKDVLELEAPPAYEPKNHRISPEQVWALDVRVAATWVRDGAWTLWKTDYEELREYWAAALDEKTELWPREDGLIRERWQLWKERLWALSTDEASLDEETRIVTKEAYEVVENMLRGV